MTREQFITHVESNQRAFRRFLVALCCGDSALADDIAQESLIKAYLSCEGFRDPDKFNAWIFRIGYNTFLNHRRSVRPMADCAALAGEMSGDSADSTFRYQDLYDALNRLSESERTSILLYYMEGYNVKEIAEVIGASEVAVRQQLSRGRIHLRGILDNENQ